jgi:autotransporter-associated beta strand protein
VNRHRRIVAVVTVLAIFAAAPARAATLFWSGNGSTQGGSGTWDTTNARFGALSGGPYTTVWNNTTNAADTVLFGGSAGTATLGDNITVRNLTFNNASTVAGSGFSLTTGVVNNLFVQLGGSARGTGATISAPIVGSNGLSLIGTAGPLVLSGSSTYAGETVVSNNAGAQNGVRLNLGNGGTGGSIGSSSGISIQATNIFSTNRSNTATQGIHFPTISGAGSFIKAGTGTTIFTAVNTYSGSTSVSSGTLLVDGTIGSGPTTVVAAAALGGSGRVSGTATISGTLSPGNTTGVLSLGSLALAATSRTLIDLPAAGARGTDYDGLTVLNASGLSYDGAMELAFGGSILADNTTFDVFSFTGTPSGSFDTLSSTGYYAGTWTNNGDGSFSLAKDAQTLTFTQSTGEVIVVPEPASLSVAAVGLVATIALLRRRNRPATRPGEAR